MTTDPLSQFDHITGLVGSRAIVYFSGRFFSPVYAHMDWKKDRPVEIATCAIGCYAVPSDRHQGCGFHAHTDVSDTEKFIEQIRGTADCIVLVETFGRVVLHELGFRAEKARIVAALDYDPRFAFFTYPLDIAPRKPVCAVAQSYFGVPLIDKITADLLIRRQRARLLGTDPNISYQPRQTQT